MKKTLLSLCFVSFVFLLKAQVFSSSNLPIVVINTNGQEIPDDPKIIADMGIIYNGADVRNNLTDGFNDYNGKIGIEIRGSSSQMFPKKQFGIELWDVNSNSIDAPLLGMPEESDWVLNVSYSDKSMLRNSFTYRTWEEMGYYSPRGQHVELVLNGEYQGVYYLCEKIKRGGDRLDIAKIQPADISGDKLTGGYILKIDKFTGETSDNWESDFPPANNPSGAHPHILIDYPKASNTAQEQFNYIKSYVDSFEVALATIDFSDTINGYRHFADEASFIDYLLISELNRNVDGYRISTYFSKDRNSRGGKLKMGPVWDYDIAYGNANYCDGWKTDGWAFDFNSVCGGDGHQVPFWWGRLMQDTLFANHLRCRWENLKPSIFDTVRIDHWIDSVAAVLEESQQRNYEKWQILGTYVWPNYYISADYAGEVDTLKWWIRERYKWLDDHIPGNLYACGFAAVNELADNVSMEVYPNPFSDVVQLKLHTGSDLPVHIEFVNLLGEVIFMRDIQPSSQHVFTLDIPSDCTSGIYLLSATVQGGSRSVKKLVKN